MLLHDKAAEQARAALARAAARAMDWQFFGWYWGDAIAIDGLLAAADVLSDQAPRAFAAQTIARWAELCPASFDDALAPGAAIARLAGDGDVPPAAADRFLASIDRLPLLAGRVPVLEPHRPAYRFGLCIDALYHLPPALAALASLRHDPDLAKRGTSMAAAILQLTQCAAGWAQWYDVGPGRNNAVAWSRGIGWALLGCLDTIALAGDDAGEPALSDAAAAMLDLLAASQQPDGHWPAVLGHPGAPAETSTAAFFVAAALHPHAPVTVSEDSLNRALDAVLASVDEAGTYGGVSADVLPSWELADYLRFRVEPSPWGQGAALRALASAAVRGGGLAEGQPDR